MSTTVVMPNLGESVLEGTIGKWLVQEGQYVERDQPVLEILTDKTDSELPAPNAGVVTKLLVKEGDVIPVGGKLFELDESAKGAAAPASKAANPPPPPSAAESEADGGKASPAVRKLARELDVELSQVKGSGQGGVITREDVLKASGQGAAAPAPAPAAKAEAPRAPTSAGATPAYIPSGAAPAGLAEALRVLGGQSAFKVPPYSPQAGDKVIPFTRRRRIIADHMVYSKLSSPHVVTFAECDLHKTSTLRDKNKDALKKEGINLTFLAFVTAAVARALREFPVMNSRVLEDSYVQFRDVNLGIAVETDEGLVVPVIRKADELRVRGIARSIDEIAVKSRDGKLTPDDLANKTFSISNPGRKGNMVGGAIISQPNVGILRIGEIKKRVVVVENDGVDSMVIHPVMYMALSYDHRVVDGAIANAFLFRINELLEKGEFDL
jgi:2-oxoglutarate dehydrogenase E2 component (dihydrolipoamide succinyltransferase)